MVEALLMDAPAETDVELAAPIELTREDRIRQRAHELYLERDGAPGDPLADWYRAAEEIDGLKAEEGE